jgi:hypothetical protein
MGKKKVADLLVEIVGEAGVQRGYGASGDPLRPRLWRTHGNPLGLLEEMATADKKPPITATAAKSEIPVKWAGNRGLKCLYAVPQGAYSGRHNNAGSDEPGREWAPSWGRVIPLFVPLNGGFLLP